jgi:hypothetical protein
VYVFGPPTMIDSANNNILHPCLPAEGIPSVKHTPNLLIFVKCTFLLYFSSVLNIDLIERYGGS